MDGEALSILGFLNHDWPPLDIDLATQETAPPPTLPLRSTFSPGWCDWIEQAAEAKGAPADYVAASILSIAGALIGNARVGEVWPGWTEPPVLFVALVGNPSSNKSPGLDAVSVPLTELEAAANEDWPQRRREYATDKLTAKLRREVWEKEAQQAVSMGHAPPTMPSEAQEPRAASRRRIYSTDTTTQKAARLSADNSRGLVLLADELAGWIGSMDRYSAGKGADRAFWLQAHGARPFVVDRVKNEEEEIAVPHLLWSVLGTIQPDRLASLLLSGDDDGLAARFIYVWPNVAGPRRPRAGLLVGPVRERLARLRDLPWTPPEPERLPFSPSAQAALQAFREEIAARETDGTGLFLSWLGKMPGVAVRLAVILSHLDWCERGLSAPPAEITQDVLARALDFIETYAIPMAKRCFGEAALPEAERDARRLARWLIVQSDRPPILNVQKLRRMANGPGVPSAERMKIALVELAPLGLVREAPPNNAGNGGRSRGDWEVNPALWEVARGMA